MLMKSGITAEQESLDAENSITKTDPINNSYSWYI
jgi:hypothetical protein